MSLFASVLNSFFGSPITPGVFPAASPAAVSTTYTAAAGSNPYPGLSNRTGNDCWANALMQLVATVPSLQAMMIELGTLLETHGDTPAKKAQGTVLKRELQNLLSDRTSRTSVSSANTENIRNALSIILPPHPRTGARIIEASSYGHARQEDAHEALSALSTLYQRMKIAAGTFTGREAGLFPLEVIRHYQEIAGDTRAPSPIVDRSNGRVRLTVDQRIRLTDEHPEHNDAYSVLGPRNTSAREDAEMFCKIEISADMEGRLNDYRLMSPHLTAVEKDSYEKQLFTEYMQSYFTSSLPTSSEAGYYFNSADRMLHAYRPYKETKHIASPPAEFILTIPRFSPDRRKYKHENSDGSRSEIQVPLQERFTLPSEYIGERATYEVDGFVRHMGDTGGGHYISYQKINGTWYEFNDARVRAMPADELKVAMQEGYFFHYRRLPAVDRSAFALPALAGDPPMVIEHPNPSTAITRPSTISATSTTVRTLHHSLSITSKQGDVAKLLKWADAFKKGNLSFADLPIKYLHKLQEMLWVRDNLSPLHPGAYGEVKTQENPATLLASCGPVIYFEGSNLIEQLVAKETAELEVLQAEQNVVKLKGLKDTFKTANKIAQYTEFSSLDAETQLRIASKLAIKEGKKTAEEELDGRGDFGREELDKNILLLSQVYKNRAQIQEIFPGNSLEGLTPSSTEQKAALKHLIDLVAAGSSDKTAIQEAFNALEENLQNKIRGLVYFEHVSQKAFVIAHSILLNNTSNITTGAPSILDETIEENENIKLTRQAILAEKKAAHAKAVSEHAGFSSEQRIEIQKRMGL